MSVTLPKKVAIRAEHTGDASKDRAQVLARAVAFAHETTKAFVAQQAALLANFRGVAVVPMNDANQVVSAAQSVRGTVIATGAVTAARTIAGFPRPTSTDGSDWYWLFFWHHATGGFNISLSDGTTSLAIGGGGQDAIVFTNAGPQVLR